MAKTEVAKKKVKKAEGGKAVKKTAKASGKSKVSTSFLIEVFAPQVVKVEGTVVSRDAAGIVLQHKRRASSKLMRTRINMSEVISIPANNGESGVVVLHTNRRSICRPLQYKGVADFSKEGVTIKTVSDGTVFVPENSNYRMEISAEEE